MLPWTLREVAALVNGRLVAGDGDAKVTGVSHDTRTLERGDLYVAVRGERFDGHRFLGRAKARGARAALVSRRVKAKGVAQVLVRDTVTALGDLGRSQRLQWGGPLVAVTGSAGKTTVKDLTAHLLAGAFRVHKNRGNWNNRYGLPLTLLGLETAHGAAVVELGINHPGEMEELSGIARPDVAVVTGIGDAHLGNFRGRGQLAAEKLKVASYLREGGIRVLNAEDVLLQGAKGDRMTFGIKYGNVRAARVESDGHGMKFEVRAQGQAMAARLALPGVHNVRNALAAVAAGLALEVPFKALVARLRSFRPQAPMRMEIRNRGGVLLLNDAYNASPASMEAALATFQGLKGPERRMAILGDMLELGDGSDAAHRRVVRLAADSGLDELVLVGPRMTAAAGSLPAGQKSWVWCLKRSGEAARVLKRWAKRGDAVLVKGSRGMGMERAVENL